MSDSDLNMPEQIQIMINHTLAQQPKPMKVTITKVYDDNKHVDCKTLNDDTLEYIPIIANNPTVNNIGVLLFLEYDEMIIISK